MVKLWTWWKSKKCWRNNYFTREKRWNIKQIERSAIKMKYYKISNLWYDPTVSKIVTKKRIEINDL